MNFKRTKGQEFVSYDTALKTQLRRLEEIGAGLSGITQAYWFLEKSGISSDLRKQVVAAAGGIYDSLKLRAALVAIVPQVSRLEGESNANTAINNNSRMWKGKSQSNAHKVHAVDQDGGDLEDETEQDERPNEGFGTEDLEAELEVLMTRLARGADLKERVDTRVKRRQSRGKLASNL